MDVGWEAHGATLASPHPIGSSHPHPAALAKTQTPPEPPLPMQRVERQRQLPVRRRLGVAAGTQSAARQRALRPAGTHILCGGVRLTGAQAASRQRAPGACKPPSKRAPGLDRSRPPPTWRCGARCAPRPAGSAHPPPAGPPARTTGAARRGSPPAAAGSAPRPVQRKEGTSQAWRGGCHRQARATG